MRFALSTSRRIYKKRTLGCAGLVLLVLAGCATLAPYDEGDLDDAVVAALPVEKAAYVYLSVPGAVEFLDVFAPYFGVDSGNMESALAGFRSIYAVLEKPVADTAGWMGIGIGNIPVGAFAGSLNVNRDWKRICGEGRRWISADGELEIALPGRQIAVVGTRNIEPVLQRLASRDQTPIKPNPDTPAGTFLKLLSENPGTGFAVYIREASDFLPLDLPPAVLNGLAASLTGDFNGDSIVARLRMSLPSAAKAKVAGVLVKALVIAEKKKDETRAFDRAGVTVSENIVSVGPFEVSAKDIIGFLERMPANTGGR